MRIPRQLAGAKSKTPFNPVVHSIFTLSKESADFYCLICVADFVWANCIKAFCKVVWKRHCGNLLVARNFKFLGFYASQMHCRLAKNNWFCNIFFYKITKGCPIKGQFHLLVESNKLFNSWVVELKAWNIWFNCSRHKMAHNDHGLLPWRTSNLVNVRRPSGVTYFKRREAAQSHGSKPMLHAVILSKMPLVR